MTSPSHAPRTLNAEMNSPFDFAVCLGSLYLAYICTTYLKVHMTHVVHPVDLLLFLLRNLMHHH